MRGVGIEERGVLVDRRLVEAKVIFVIGGVGLPLALRIGEFAGLLDIADRTGDVVRNHRVADRVGELDAGLIGQPIAEFVIVVENARDLRADEEGKRSGGEAERLETQRIRIFTAIDTTLPSTMRE